MVMVMFVGLWLVALSWGYALKLMVLFLGL